MDGEKVTKKRYNGRKEYVPEMAGKQAYRLKLIGIAIRKTILLWRGYTDCHNSVPIDDVCHGRQPVMFRFVSEHIFITAVKKNYEVK